MKLKRIILTSAMSFLSIGSHASSCSGESCRNQGLTHFIILSAGPTWASAGSTQSFYRTTATPLEIVQQNQFVANNNTNSMGSGEIYVALGRNLGNWLAGRLGIAAAWSGNAKLQGTVNFTNAPNAAQYSYKINHGRIAIKGLLASTIPRWVVQPYLSGSFGVGYNNSYGFRTIPGYYFYNDSGQPTGFGYANNTDNGFAYTVGIGVMKALTPNWQVGVGYEFADWGKNSLKSVLATPFDFSAPHQTHLYTNQLQFTLSYLY